VFRTREVYNGKETYVDAAFRAYPTFEGSVKDHNDLLQNKRYAKVLTAKDYKEASVEIWKAGYATDPKYPELLIRIIEQFKLYEYDKKQPEKKLNETKTKKKEDDKMNLKESDWENLEKEIESFLNRKIINNEQCL
jgi:flagellum-specific peptidoglycan hydrolase FlgJ